MKPSTFRQLIRKVLNEEVEKKSDTGAKTFSRVPEIVHAKIIRKLLHINVILNPRLSYSMI